MFGTLVIQLPSDYEGGQLLVYHNGKKAEFTFGGCDACCNFYFTAFYADCQHEVKPVTKGYRLCLIYNLLYAGVNECPAPADNQKLVSSIVSAIQDWNQDIYSIDCPNMMTYMLEHQYTKGLSFQLLKNGDKRVANVLAQAKGKVDFDLYVSTVHVTESWSAFSYDWPPKHITASLEEEEANAKGLIACDGTALSSVIILDKKYFIPQDFFSSIAPSKETYYDSVGVDSDAGDRLDKHYKWAALQFWPIRKRTAVLGGHDMVGLLRQEISNDDRKTHLTDIAKDIMRERNGEWFMYDYLNFLQALLQMGDKELIVECLDVDVWVTIDNWGDYFRGESLATTITTIGHDHGWNILESPLSAIFTKCKPNTTRQYCEFLLKISSGQLGAEQRELYYTLADVVVNCLASEEDAAPVSKPPRRQNCGFKVYYHIKAINKSKEFVSLILNVFSTLGFDDLLSSAVSALRSKPILYPVLETLGPALVDVGKEVKLEGSLQELLKYCIDTLEDSVDERLAPPSNQTRAATFLCTCHDCVELKKFLQHPSKNQHQFKIGMKRRDHLQQQLDDTWADATYVTEHIGSPHTLVITKTQESYKEKLQRHQKEQTLLAALQPLFTTEAESRPPIKKLRTGCSTSEWTNVIECVCINFFYIC